MLCLCQETIKKRKPLESGLASGGLYSWSCRSRRPTFIESRTDSRSDPCARLFSYSYITVNLHSPQEKSGKNQKDYFLSAKTL